MKGSASESEHFLAAFSAFLPGGLLGLGLVSSVPLAGSRLFLPFLDSTLAHDEGCSMHGINIMPSFVAVETLLLLQQSAKTTIQKEIRSFV
jgi:hypothetical protein